LNDEDEGDIVPDNAEPVFILDPRFKPEALAILGRVIV
jgi:hypothetical protein